MFTVSVLIGSEEVGTIRFRGIKVHQPDGSVRIPTREGMEIPFSLQCKASGQISESQLFQLAGEIAEALARNFVTGRVGEYEWRVN